MSFTVIIAYLLTLGIPSLIIGYGAFADDLKTSIMIAWISFVSFMAYYTYHSIIPVWILILALILLSLIFVMLFSQLFNNGGSE